MAAFLSFLSWRFSLRLLDAAFLVLFPPLSFLAIGASPRTACDDGHAPLWPPRSLVPPLTTQLLALGADDVDSLGKLVVTKIQAVEGVTRTLTCPVVHLWERVGPGPVGRYLCLHTIRPLAGS